ncbi:hypothetical protein SPOG_04870 [Schizosaccharomyces cryophilus OY26]|uniref:Uncharacterized protein n=1 Tax=Schizosaccharomyces cryophilus (strain OY26 / ATCC MYA-4695 / CBS 11777 / NBRC 106824 / NRRL Y48691) TaxID=653667 RepID=S9W2G2_SCHCR|nr:uncharacterized protein SPOG_04870 [Schizosaccharomyces cryophilus OY26]EPY52215.1 hypothetical protein SPOG_04870 [Schizosaccharomyces cryophilus OY26]
MVSVTKEIKLSINRVDVNEQFASHKGKPSQYQEVKISISKIINYERKGAKITKSKPNPRKLLKLYVRTISSSKNRTDKYRMVINFKRDYKDG